MGIAAGRLRDRVTINEPNLVDNGVGGRKPAQPGQKWRKVRDAWAEVVALRGGEAMRQGIERSSQFYRVTLRICTDVTVQNQIVWKGIAMDIRAAAPNEERDGLVLTCESVAGR